MLYIYRFLTVCAFVFALLTSLHAQYDKNTNGIAVRKTFLDYYSSSEGGYPNLNKLSGGWELGFFHNISPRINIGIPVRFGIVELPEEIVNTTLFGIDAVVQVQDFDRDKLLNPYLVAGIGFTSRGFGFKDPTYHAPVGAGLNINLFNGAYANIQADYRKGISKSSQDYIQYGVGVMFLLKKEIYKKKKENPVDKLNITKYDIDGDGVPNVRDDCPKEFGKKSLLGCPDMDDDGIADMNDLCPDIPGTVSGCPDSDGDNIADIKDKCPEEKGEYPDGCPKKDEETIASPDFRDSNKNSSQPSDKNDEKDIVAQPTAKAKVPFTAPADDVLTSRGVSELARVELNTTQVNFSSGEVLLDKESEAALDQLALFMKQNPYTKVALEGHADFNGTRLKNLALSESRARACYDYLLRKGVPHTQMEYRAFGELRPLIKNRSAKAREANRRVEFVILP